MTFTEAEERFRWLERQRRIRRLSMEEYRQALKEMRITDSAGRTWMLQERTGYWHVWDGRQWQLADPHRLAPPPQAQAPRPAPQPQQQAPWPQPQPAPQPQAPSPQPAPAPGPQPQARPAPQQVSGAGSGCAKFLLYGVIWAVLWTVVAVGAFFLWGREEPMVLAGVGLAAVISAVLTIIILLGNWEGQIVEMRSERKRVDDGDGDWHYENRLYAYIRQPNGKIRKEAALPGWQVGDRLAKRRGEMNVTKLG